MSAPEKLTALNNAFSNAWSLAAASEDTMVATPVTSYQDATDFKGINITKMIENRLFNIFFIDYNRSGINIALTISVKFGGFFFVRQIKKSKDCSNIHFLRKRMNKERYHLRLSGESNHEKVACRRIDDDPFDIVRVLTNL